jgi:hypothetical protein
MLKFHLLALTPAYRHLYIHILNFFETTTNDIYHGSTENMPRVIKWKITQVEYSLIYQIARAIIRNHTTR